MTLDELTQQVRQFALERDWEQFHTPKNLAMALVGEVGELVAEFQWLTAEESAALTDEQRARVVEEVGDVLIYLTRLCDVLGIDPVAAAGDKLDANRARYTIEAARGSAEKIQRG